VSERALSFGSAANAYHRFRPGYPDELVDLVVAHADGEVKRALEIGAGTGKATTLFAARGIEVLAVEPDQGMRAVLAAETRDLPVQVLASTLETVDLEAVGQVDLVFAAAALHWTDAETRWRRIAAVLRSGGVAAFFGGPTDLADPALAQTVDRIEVETFGGNRHISRPDEDEGGLEWPGSDLVREPEFTDVAQRVLPRRVNRPTDDFVSHLATVSQYLVQPADRRATALARIRAALPDRVDVIHDVTVHLARRV
jgi:SAM-dependent methyltransferase